MKKISLFVLMFVFVQINAGFAQRSLYQDYKATRIGDLVTIILQENITGSSSADNSNRSGVNGGAQGGVSGNLSPFLPLFGANASVNYQSDERNGAQQSQLLRGNVSARIEEILPNGDLYLVGSRSNEINGELHKLEIKGFVRPNDIDSYNQISSFRIANAEIMYLKQGGSQSMIEKPNFWEKALWITLGAGLAATAYFGVF